MRICIKLSLIRNIKLLSMICLEFLEGKINSRQILFLKLKDFKHKLYKPQVLESTIIKVKEKNR